MNFAAILSSPFIQITLPLLVPIVWAMLDIRGIRNEMREGFQRIDYELKEIRKELAKHGERIARLEERLPPLVHR